MRSHNLTSVCEEARCPNIAECFERGTATIMIMGDVCTRDCPFCAVKSGTPSQLDPDEPLRVARQVKEWGLKHAVITSVTRDDLPDGGALHFAKVIHELRRHCTSTRIEVLVPDFEGDFRSLKVVCGTKPDVFNHNIETVERLTPDLRDKRSSYKRSLTILETASKLLSNSPIKSGIIVGIGEEDREIKQCLKDIHKTGCRALTIGQYLQPSLKNPPVKRYVEPEKFDEYRKLALDIGFNHVFSGPFVRSSYMADSFIA